MRLPHPIVHSYYVVISRFEDIQSWQFARTLAVKIYRISRRGDFGKDFGLRDQIQRAAVSVMANIAEGFGRNGKAEFSRYLAIAQASVVEVQSHLYIANDLGYITREEFEHLYALAQEIQCMTGGFIRYLRGAQKQSATRNEKLETSAHTSQSNPPPH